MLFKNVNERLTADLVLDVSFYSVYEDDLFRVMVLYQMGSEITNTLVVLGLDAGHIRDIDFERKHGDAGSLEACADTLLLIREIICVGEHYRAVESLGIREVENVKLAFILQLVVVRGTIGNEHEHVNAVFSGFFLKTRNHMLDELAAEAVCKYSYPLVHSLIPHDNKKCNLTLQTYIIL